VKFSSGVKTDIRDRVRRRRKIARPKTINILVCRVVTRISIFSQKCCNKAIWLKTFMQIYENNRTLHESLFFVTFREIMKKLFSFY
jgi:hypothetical protein